ncbi:unnamed protein product [Phytophthora lilii]|uniref:Unnamed protein product n=1 Tax=Phytophthora lilii TaxID=2077276 RepID=A0A9W6TS85_9STRA|nr:unnamed protein product [Phytophthora lilii]
MVLSHSFLLLVVAVALLGFVSALHTGKDSYLASTKIEAGPSGLASVRGEEKPLFRSLEAVDNVASNNDQKDEERAINFSFLKNLEKYLPGTEAFKTATAARNAAAKARKAEEIGKKYAVFKLPAEHRDQDIYPAFKKWYAAKESPEGAATGLKALGYSDDVIKDIRERYWSWLQTAHAGTKN